MSIQRVDKFDIQKLATAQTVAEARFKLRKQALSKGGVCGVYDRKKDNLIFIEIETYNDLKEDELSHWEDVASCYNEFRRLES